MAQAPIETELMTTKCPGTRYVENAVYRAA
jgi:hypothetical protein